MSDIIEPPLPYPEWQGPLREVMLEFDPERLAEKALRAEALILERRQQLQQSSNHHDERVALDDGLFILKTIKTCPPCCPAISRS